MSDGSLTDADLQAVLDGGLEPFSAELVDHDPRWGLTAKNWCERLRTVLPPDATVEHVGSTSVADIKAKPVIDLLITVTDPESPDLEQRLASLGLDVRVRSAGRRSLRTVDHGVQVHVLRHGDRLAREVIRLRDVLRRDPQARRQYEQEKLRLAQRSWSDMHYYSEAKGPVIRAILDRASSEM